MNYLRRVIAGLLFIEIYQLGYLEGNGDIGRTYGNNPESLRSIAYDAGRTKRRIDDEARNSRVKNG